MSMTNTRFTIKDHNRAEAEYRIHKFCLLVDTLRALEIASCATEFTHGHTEWAMVTINETRRDVAEHLAEMVHGNGFAQGMDDETAKWERGIMSDSDYYWVVGFYLRSLLVRK